MSLVSFRKGSDRNTQAYKIWVGGVLLFISYETVVAVNTGEQKLRRYNEWGPTTSRHMREMGCSGYQEVSEEELDQAIDRAIFVEALEKAGRKFKHGA